MNIVVSNFASIRLHYADAGGAVQYSIVKDACTISAVASTIIVKERRGDDSIMAVPDKVVLDVRTAVSIDTNAGGAVDNIVFVNVWL